MVLFFFKQSYPEDVFIDFRDRGRETEREKCQSVPLLIPHAPQLGTKPATQVYALTKNQTHDLFGAQGDSPIN